MATIICKKIWWKEHTEFILHDFYSNLYIAFADINFVGINFNKMKNVSSYRFIIWPMDMIDRVDNRRIKMIPPCNIRDLIRYFIRLKFRSISFQLLLLPIIILFYLDSQNFFLLLTSFFLNCNLYEITIVINELDTTIR